MLASRTENATACVLRRLLASYDATYSSWTYIQLWGFPMTTGEYVALLSEARLVLERYLFDGVDLRDDVAEVCAKIDDALPPAVEAHEPKALQGIERAA